MFLDPGRFDLYNFFEFRNNSQVGFLKHINEGGIIGAYKYLKEQPLAIVIIVPIVLLFNLFKGIGFVLFWIKNHKTSAPIFWFMLFIMVYLTVLVGLIGASRFLLPILPIYLFFAVLGYLKHDSPVQLIGTVETSLQ
jgi:hypothetical protein